jgi:hypothetical protein
MQSDQANWIRENPYLISDFPIFSRALSAPPRLCGLKITQQQTGSVSEAERKQNGSISEALRKREIHFFSKKTNNSASGAKKKSQGAK